MLMFCVWQIFASFIPLFISLVLFKILGTDQLTELTAQKRHAIFALAANEARLYAYLLALTLLAVVSGNRFVTGGVKAVITFILLCALVDAGAVMIFYARLDFTDVYKFLFQRDTQYSLEVIRLLVRQRDRRGYLYIALLALLVVSLAAFWTTAIPQNNGWAGILLVSAVLLFLPAGFINAALGLQHGWGVQNIIDVNLALYHRYKPYSQAFTQQLLTTYRAPQQACLSGIGKTPAPNLILIVMESLSMHHSRYLSGLNDFTPHLDALMQENTVFTNFYANGLTSEEGLIALLLGKFPLASPRCRFLPDSKVFSQAHASIPTFLQSRQYQTAFLTATDFHSFGIGEWAKNIGFQTVKSRETMRFDHSRGLGLPTVTDDVLYFNALMTMQSLRTPYFLTLETGMTHEPFVDPETQAVSEERCFEYADRKLFEFIQALEAQRFFENGLVFVVSDHRQRGAARPEEAELYGESAAFRIPFIMIDGRHAPRRVETAYQQSDFFLSLKYLLTQEQLPINPMQGVFLPMPQVAPQYILAKHAGGLTGMVHVFQEGRCERVILDGDQTRFENRQAQWQAALDYLNYTRLTNTA